ncbi:MAG: lipopolysaccharide biosynthesis protein [Novosphingobium sp.]|nr:lipopolysaccharide biosynthesis protein [Novosphingobium sp.]
MGRAAFRGSVFMGAAQAVQFASSMISLLIVARLLSPDDYGVVAMCTPITAFLLLFQDFGLSSATIQARSISPEQVSTMAWLNVGISLVIAAILIAISPLVSAFYGDVRAGYFTAASALTVIVSGLSLQQLAMLTREHRFGALAWTSTAGSLGNLGGAIVGALVLRDYWAIFVGQVCAAVAGTLVPFLLSPWRPSLAFSIAKVRSLLGFGSALTGFTLLNVVSRNADNLLIGRFWGPIQLGHYDVSYKLILMPLNNVNAPMSRVMLPILARVREEDTRFRHIFLSVLRGITFLTMPGLIVAVALSDNLLPWALGQHWRAASPILFWLVLAGLFQPTNNVIGLLFVALGRGKELFQFGIIRTACIVAAFAISVQFSVVALASAYFWVTLVISPANWLWGARGTPVRFLDILKAIAPIFFASGAVGLALRYVEHGVPFAVLLIVGTGTAYLASFVVLLANPSARKQVRDVGQMVRVVLMLGRRS